MHGNKAQIRIEVAALLGLALALTGCQQKRNDAGVPQPQQMMVPVNGAMQPPAAPGAAGAPAPGVPTDPNAMTPVQQGMAGSGAEVPPPAQGGEQPAPGGDANPQPGTEEPVAGMGAEEPPPTEETPPAHEDLGKGDGSDVITMGDSWMSLGIGAVIEGALDRAGTKYRHYAVPGTLLSGTIPGQFDQAVRANPDIKTVLMTGGGNDIMFSGGCNTKEACEKSVAEISKMLNTLWTKMADANVKDVVYIQYSKNAGTAPSDTRPTTPPPPPEICLSGRIRCHSLPTTEEVGPGDTIDGIHPTNAASDRIVVSLMKLMEEQGIRR